MISATLLTNISQGGILHEGIPLPFSLEQADGIFILCTICFMMFAYIYQGSFKTAKTNLSLAFSFNPDSYESHSLTTRDIWYSYYLILQFTIFVSITAYSYFIENPGYRVYDGEPSITIIMFIVVISTFLLLKRLIYKMIGSIFDIQQEMKIFEYSQLFIIELLGIIYFIPTLLVIYSGYAHNMICTLMAVVFIVVQFIFFCQQLTFFVRKKFNFLFSIAYLCTVEIIPYVLLITAIIYLYNNTKALIVLW